MARKAKKAEPRGWQIGRRIKEAREANGISQEKLSLAVSQILGRATPWASGVVSGWESGKKKDFFQDQIEAIARVLDINPDYLASGNKTVPRKSSDVVSTNTEVVSITTPTGQAYPELSHAFQHFNERLFDGKLPECLFTLVRKSHRTRGYYSNKRFVHKGVSADAAVTDEIAMNPDYFSHRPDRETLSTIVHEMVHHWQAHFGNAPRACYHDSQWADKMESVGLIPSDTGLPGGKRTGQTVSHYIADGGAFDRACNDLLATGYAITWASLPPKQRDGKAGQRQKYICPLCSLQLEGKFEAHVICGDCGVIMPGVKEL